MRNRPACCTSNAGLIMLTQQAALDYALHNIRCNVICPEGVTMPMTMLISAWWGKWLGMDTETFVSFPTHGIPFRRFAEPNEIAGMCVYLAR